jgi:hypothetical protein
MIKELPVMVMKTDLLNVMLITGLLRIANTAKMLVILVLLPKKVLLDFSVKQLQVTLQLVSYNISLMPAVGLPYAMIEFRITNKLKVLSEVIWMLLDTKTVKFSLKSNQILLITMVSLDQTLLVSLFIILQMIVLVLKQAIVIVQTLGINILMCIAHTVKIYMLFVVNF